jgi:ribonuclease HI
VCSDSQYAIQCVRNGASGWEKRGWKKAGGEIKNLEIIQARYTIYQRIESDLQLSCATAHVGTEGNEHADRMAMLAVAL